jgi:ATP-binding cassette, subfamily G (WHITE), member 2, SNQ2
MLSNSVVSMQNRLFSIFMTVTISPPLMQQLQPRFIKSRRIFRARENPSKTYHWFAFVFAAIIAEMPWAFLFGTIYFCCWYFGVGFPRDATIAGYVWLMFMAFDAFYVSFGQFMAAMAPNELFAALLVPTLFSFVVAFCGVVVPAIAIPHFWRSWMYCTFHVFKQLMKGLSPLHYYMEGTLASVIHGQKVVCAPSEFAQFFPPSGKSCADWAGQYIAEAGGYLINPNSTAICQYCPYADGDEYVP